MMKASGLALAALLLTGGVALASPFTITTTGTITSGSDTANLLGAGATLVGDRYVLTVNYDGLGPSAFTSGSGQFAQDIGDTILGSISVTIGQQTTTTALSANTAASLIEDTSDLNATNSGNDPAGNYAYASQSITGANAFVPFADLQTGFSYKLAAGDSGIDTYSFSIAGNAHTASFTGATSTVQFAVPEPATWALLGSATLGLLWARRRGAV